MRRFLTSLYGQVLVATAVGVVVGHYFPQAGTAMKPLGDGFIKLVRMIVAPIIFCTVVVGIAGVGDIKAVGRTGVMTLVYFEIVSTLALIVGLVVVNVVRPGVGMNVDVSSLDRGAVAQYAPQAGAQHASDFLLSIIPSSVVDAFARTDILQVLFFSVLFGLALSGLGASGRLVTEFIDNVSRVLFAIVGMIMRVAPLGAFGAMAFTVGSFGVGTLAQLGTLVMTFYATCVVFAAIVFGAIAWAHGFSLWRFIAYIKDELFIAFGTSSSETVLPRIMGRLEQVGVDRSVVGLVIPAGYSFNLDGSALYLSIAAVFIAQATNTRLPWPRQVALLAILMLTSKGTAGVAGAALVVLSGTLAATQQIPVAGVALVLGIHRFMGQAMAVTNTIGNGVATIVIGRWCRKVDTARLNAQLGVGGRASRRILDEPLF